VKKKRRIIKWKYGIRVSSLKFPLASLQAESDEVEATRPR